MPELPKSEWGAVKGRAVALVKARIVSISSPPQMREADCLLFSKANQPTDEHNRRVVAIPWSQLARSASKT